MTDNEEKTQLTSQWGRNAPAGARAVVENTLSPGAKVPLFIGQSLIHALRDVGYNSTTSALCEHVDNAIQAGATKIRVYFHQSGKRGDYQIQILVYDNGRGMSRDVLNVAMALGGSTSLENRENIGRFGVGMKTAALSIGPAMEVYSWQERNAIYTLGIDLVALGQDTSNPLELATPMLHDQLPSNICKIFTTEQKSPAGVSEQDFLASDEDSLNLALGESGTIMYIPACDRLSSKKAATLTDHAIKEMSRVYRYHIGEKGLQLFINNYLVKPFDPTYYMPNAQHNAILANTKTKSGNSVQITRSELVDAWEKIDIPLTEGSTDVAPVTVRLYKLPIEEWHDLTDSAKKQLRVFEVHQVSFMRNNREVYIGNTPALMGARHGTSHWVSVQIDFPGILDDAFGIAMNKQGVRSKDYALDIIGKEIKKAIQRIKDGVATFQKQNSQKRKDAQSRLTHSEEMASSANSLQGKPLPSSAPLTEDEQKILDEKLYEFSAKNRRNNETEEEAFLRVKGSKYVTIFKDDPHWPFYDIEYRFDKVILTINTAHPFYTLLYEPLANLVVSTQPQEEEDAGDVSDTNLDNLVTALEMLMFSLGHVQSEMLLDDTMSKEKKLMFENLCRSWSDVLKTQLQTMS